MGKFTHFVYGIKWVKSGDGVRILEIRNPGANARGFFDAAGVRPRSGGSAVVFFHKRTGMEDSREATNLSLL